MRTLQEIDKDRAKNRDQFGIIKNNALDRRLCAEERMVAIAILGMAPETEPYAASTGELRKWAEHGEATKP